MLGRFFKSLVWMHRAFWAWGIVVLVVIAGWCLLHFRAISDYLDRYRDRNAVRGEIESLRTGNDQLERQRDELARGGFESEKEARERLDLIKPGEYVLHIDSRSVSDSLTTPTARPRIGSPSRDAPSLPPTRSSSARRATASPTP